MTKQETEYISNTLDMMKRQLHPEPQEMVKQILEAEGRVGYCYDILSRSNSDLDKALDAAAELIKTDPLKAYAFEVKVKSMVSGHRAERDRVQGLIKSLEGRQMAGAVILRYLRGLPQE